jgi:predicted transcriptional regulator
MTEPSPPVKKKKKKKRNVTKRLGRPTSFNAVIQERIVELAKAGATEVEIAKNIGVSDRTIRYWKKLHEEFVPALKEAKDVADQLVEASLFQRAIGYQRPAVKHFLDKKQVYDEVTGAVSLKTVVIEHEYIEHHAPSEVAAIFWLKNRQPDRWRDKPEPAKPEDNGLTEIVYEAEWGGTGEPTTPHLPSDGDGEAQS